jgi:hypothetical protein
MARMLQPGVTGADTRAQRARGRRYDCRVLLCTSLPATRADTHVNRLLQPLWLRMARRTGLLQQVIVCSLHVLYNTATGTRTEWKGNIPELQLTQAVCGCKFVPDSAPPPQPSLTVLQEVMSIGPVELGSLHAQEAKEL